MNTDTHPTEFTDDQIPLPEAEVVDPAEQALTEESIGEELENLDAMMAELQTISADIPEGIGPSQDMPFAGQSVGLTVAAYLKYSTRGIRWIQEHTYLKKRPLQAFLAGDDNAIDPEHINTIITMIQEDRAREVRIQENRHNDTPLAPSRIPGKTRPARQSFKKAMRRLEKERRMEAFKAEKQAKSQEVLHEEAEVETI